MHVHGWYGASLSSSTLHNRQDYWVERLMSALLILQQWQPARILHPIFVRYALLGMQVSDQSDKFLILAELLWVRLVRTHP